MLEVVMGRRFYNAEGKVRESWRYISNNWSTIYVQAQETKHIFLVRTMQRKQKTINHFFFLRVLSLIS